MAPLRSLGNTLSAFDDFYARTGKDAVGAGGPAPETSIIPYGLDQSSAGSTDFLNRNYSSGVSGRRTWTFATWFKKDTSSTLWLHFL